MRSYSTTRMIAPLMLSLLLAILAFLTLACNLIPPSAESLALQTASANLQSTLDKLNDAKTVTADAANRHATATRSVRVALAAVSLALPFALREQRQHRESEYDPSSGHALKILPRDGTLPGAPLTHAYLPHIDRLPPRRRSEPRVGDQKPVLAQRDKAGIAARIHLQLLPVGNRNQRVRLGPRRAIVRAESQIHPRPPRRQHQDSVREAQ